LRPGSERQRLVFRRRLRQPVWLMHQMNPAMFKGRLSGEALKVFSTYLSKQRSSPAALAGHKQAMGGSNLPAVAQRGNDLLRDPKSPRIG
jgi:hypothetical protein